VGTHLIRHWASSAEFELLVIGSGPLPPADGIRYVQIRWHTREKGQDPSALSVKGYAHFCVQFAQKATEYLQRLARDFRPSQTCIVHHDVAEAPDFARLKALGYRQVGIFHVDVVDYVAHIYLRNLFSAPQLAKFHRNLARVGLHRFLPRILRLIFSKQEECVRHCDRLVVPSHPMAEILTQSYPQWAPGKTIIIPWGAITGLDDEAEATLNTRERYGISDSVPVLITLSRISPEKGQDLLLRALHIWERKEATELVLFICGAPAFMHGRRYFSHLVRLARKLTSVKVYFPGYVAGPTKTAFLHSADLYVFPSRHESYGLTLAEALVAGLPVLATDHHAARDLVRPEFGLIVEPTPKAIYRGLVRLLGNREGLKEMGARAREFAASLRFENAAREFSDLIRSLI